MEESRTSLSGIPLINYHEEDTMNLKMIALALMTGLLTAEHLAAQQFTPPAMPPGTTGSSEVVQGEILKVYSLDDKGAKYRAYVVTYKGTEVVAESMVNSSDMKVGDKVTFIAVRVELARGDTKINTLQFKIMNMPGAKKAAKTAP
jgi:hypothetical protein